MSLTHEEPIVGEVMEKAVLAVDMNTNVKDCSKAMVKRGVSSAVVTQAGSAFGIVTERDLVAKVLADAVDPTKVFVRDIMSTPLITIAPEVAITEASALMAEYRIRRLVVVEKNGALVGIVTTGDIARHLAEKHGYKEPTFNAMARYNQGVEGGPYQ